MSSAGELLSIEPDGVFGEGVLSTELYSITVDPKNNTLYVADSSSKSISAFNLANNNKELKDKKIKGIGPLGLAIFKDILYAADWGSNSIRAFDLAGNKELEDKKIEGITPYGLAIFKDILYAGDEEDSSIRAFDLADNNKKLKDKKIKGLIEPYDLAIHKGRLYITDSAAFKDAEGGPVSSSGGIRRYKLKFKEQEKSIK